MEDPQTTEPLQQATSPPPAPHSSALNPDAQVFVPALNPNARAFYPRQSMLPPASSDMDFLAATKAPPTAPSSRDSGCGSLSQANSGEDTPPSKPSTPTPPENGDLCVTPIMEDEDLKAIGERKQTPWVDGAKSAGAAVTTTTVGNPSDVHQRVEKEETEEKGDLLYPLRACSVEGRRRRRKSSASSDEEQEAEQSEVEDLLSPLVVCSLEGRRRKRRSASSEDDEQSEEEENEEEDNTAAG